MTSRTPTARGRRRTGSAWSPRRSAGSVAASSRRSCWRVTSRLVPRRPVDARWLLGRLAERYPECWTFSVDGLVGATPELLVRREKGLVTSRVLAGTIRRTGDDAHDLALAARAGPLEQGPGGARVRRALGRARRSRRTARRRTCPRRRSCCTWRTSCTSRPTSPACSPTTSSGLAAGRRAAPVRGGLRHADHVRGRPDRRARGHGPRPVRRPGRAGWTPQGDGEWGIALRCARLDPADPRRARLFAGCGIVAGSDPEAELAESDAKLVPMRDALASD